METLSREDRERITAILRSRPKPKLKLKDLLGTWAWLVAQIEKGYNDDLGEYQNDVWVRYILDDVLRLVPADTARRLGALLQPFDERFLAATVPCDRPIGPVSSRNTHDQENASNVKAEWYFTRVPRKPGRELEADLELQGR